MRDAHSISGGDGGPASGPAAAAWWLVPVVALAMLWAAVEVPSAAAAKPAHAKHLIVSPVAGKLLPARPTAIRVRAARRAKVGVRLNGKRIGAWLSRPSRRGVRHLRVSPSHGLRYGRNVLWVRVRGRGARRARVQRIRFRIRRNRPLAAAGLDRHVALHAGFSLTGHRSRPHRPRGSKPLHYRWRVIDAPPGSHLRRGRPRRAKGSAQGTAPVENLGPAPLFALPAQVSPRLRLDQPGSYRLQLTVTGADGRVGSDQVTVVADPDPAVSINTMARPQGAKSWGVQVGKQFYEDPGEGGRWLQLVVLDAKTLEAVANRAFDCPAATGAAIGSAGSAAIKKCIAAVTTYAQGLPKAYPKANGFLAIAVSQLPPGKFEFESTQAPVGWWSALEPFGAEPAKGGLYRHPGKPSRGTLSFVGILGATKPLIENVGFDLSQRVARRVSGLLVRDNHKSYSSFASADRATFDTEVGSSPTQSVIRVGDQVFTEPITEGGGFHVVLVSKGVLSPGPEYEAASHWFPTHGKSPDGVRNAISAMAGVLQAARQGDNPAFTQLAFIASRGDPRIVVKDDDPGLAKAVRVLADLLVKQYGATSTRVFQALDPTLAQNEGLLLPQPAGSYTLVAEAGTKHARGLERSGPVDEQGFNTVPVTGALTRSSPSFDYVLEAGGIAPGQPGGGGEALREVAFGEGGEWPEQGRSRAYREAIEYVGRKAVGARLWDAERSVYWTKPYDTGEFWRNTKALVATLRYPGRRQVRFRRAEFNWAKQELGNEITWLQETHGYAADLAKPFEGPQRLVSAYVEKIASEVSELVKPEEDDEALLLFEDIIEGAREAADALPVPAGTIAKGINVIWNTATRVSKTVEEAGTKEVAEPFEVTAANLGAELGKRLEIARNTLENQLVDVVAADYRKLRTVGLCAADRDGCKSTAEWVLTQDNQKEMADAIKRGLKISIYGALLPAKWDAWYFPTRAHASRSTWWRIGGSGTWSPSVTGFPFPAVKVWYCPFKRSAKTAQLWWPVQRGFGGAMNLNQVVAYADRYSTPKVPGVWWTLPSSAITDPLFDPLKRGGLGVDPETFWRHNYGPAREQREEAGPEAEEFEWISDAHISRAPSCTR